MNYDFDLTQKWSQVPRNENRFTLCDPRHPLGWNIGFDSSMKYCILLITTDKPSLISSTRLLNVTINSRFDNKWELRLTLLDDSSKDVFIQLCNDLVIKTFHLNNDIKSSKFVFERILMWMKLFETLTKQGMTKSKAMGIFGEVLFIKKLIENGISPSRVLTAWKGPENSDQDFLFENIWFEIKTNLLGKNSISISSKEQLSPSKVGHIKYFQLDDRGELDDSTTTLVDLVRSVKDQLDMQDNFIFQNKLLEYGYFNEIVVEKYSFSVVQEQTFIVNDTFPKLIPTEISMHIDKVVYSIFVSGLDEWRIDNESWRYL